MVWAPPPLELPPVAEAPTTGRGEVVIVTDEGPDDRRLGQMVGALERLLSLPVHRVNLRDMKIKGGCLGCMSCADDETCVYEDEVGAAYERIRQADVVIFAGTVQDRFLSARHRIFTDRYFRYGHRPVLEGKLVGYVVSGPVSQLAPLRQILEAGIEIAHCHRLGIVTDERADGAAVVARLECMARDVERRIDEPWFAPPTFLGVGGHKVFRDLVYENRGVLSADHRFYQSRGLYDFPQYKIGKQLFSPALLAGKKVPFLEQRIGKSIRAGHVRRFRKVVAGDDAATAA